MGNFNYLCAASQQVIEQGNRCFVLPIIQQTSYSTRLLKINGKTIKVPGVSRHHCYPDCQWAWLGNFLEATYTSRSSFELLNTVPNQVRMFYLAYTLMEKAAIAHEGSVLPSFDIRSFIADKHQELYAALTAAKPTYESDWRLIVPTNLAEHFDSLGRVFEYLYEGVVQSMVFVEASKQDNTVTAMQFAVYSGVVFDKLVSMGEAEKGAAREFFEKAQPQVAPARPGGRLAAFMEVLDDDGFDQEFGDKAPQFKEVLNQEIRFAMGQLVNTLQQATYYSAHGAYGEFEEVTHGMALNKATMFVEDACFEAARAVIEARFALNAMGREHLVISPMRTCGDEGNCYGEQYAEFIADASSAVTASIPVRG